MRILLVEHLNRRGAALAEALSESGHSVFVLHPEYWEYECSFCEAQGSVRSLTSDSLNKYDAVVCLQDPQDASCVGILAELILTMATPIPMILLEEQPLDTVTACCCTAASSQFLSYAREYGLKGCALTVPAMYGTDFLPESAENAMTSCIIANKLPISGSAKDKCDLMHVADVSSLILHLLEGREPCRPCLRVHSGQEFLLEAAVEEAAGLPAK